MAGENNVIFEENRVADEISLLGGKTFTTLPTGQVLKIVRVPVCDVCGVRIEEDFTVCHSCGRKLCSKCCIFINGRNCCSICLTESLPLDKQQYKILVAIANNITKSNAICSLTSIPKDEIRVARIHLLNLGLIRIKGLSIFSEFCVTDLGMEAIAAYRQLFAKDEDVACFEKELSQHILKR